MFKFYEFMLLKEEFTMTFDDQQKCSEMWLMASGDYIAPRDWTDGAGDELAKFFAGIYGCSKAMSYVPKPVGSIPGWGWIVGHVYQVLKNKYNLNKTLIFNGCSAQGLVNFKSTIPAECIK